MIRLPLIGLRSTSPLRIRFGPRRPRVHPLRPADLYHLDGGSPQDVGERAVEAARAWAEVARPPAPEGDASEPGAESSGAR